MRVTRTNRKRGLIIDRSGGRPWVTRCGSSVIPIEQWELTTFVATPPQSVPRGVRVVVLEDFTERSLVEAISREVQVGPVHRLSTTSEHFLELAARLREDYGIAGNGVTYTARLRDKLIMKKHALAHGISTMPGTRADRLEPWLDAVDGDYGFVLKPINESGSVGVRIISSKGELRRAVSALAETDRHLVEVRSQHPILHVDVVVTPNDLVMEVSRYERPCHVSGGAVPLSSYTVNDDKLRSDVELVIRAIVNAWEIRADVLHIELFDDPAGVVLLELAGRPGGAGVPAVFSHTRGIDLAHAKTRLDFGIDPTGSRTAPLARHGGWTVLYAPTDAPAVVDDGAVYGHITRSVLEPDARRVDGVAGVGVATYSFAEDSVQEVRRRIRDYENLVSVRPVDASSESSGM